MLSSSAPFLLTMSIEVADDRVDVLYSWSVDVAPGVLRHRRVGLPEERSDVGELAALDVETPAGLGEGSPPCLVVDGDALAPLARRGCSSRRRSCCR